jgi:formylglycine-generating enzyme required for sulfatase activity
MRRPVWGAFALGLCACTLLTDLDGLEGDGAGDAGGTDASLAMDAAPEAAIEGGAAADAGPDGACKGTKGPTPVRVGTYCIDATEVKGRDYQEFLAAKAGDTSGQPAECAWNTSYQPSIDATGDNPVFGADWCDAYAYCAWAGKRLCGAIGGGPTPMANLNNAFSSEWYRACSHDGERDYPYGNTRNPNACNGIDRDGGNGPVKVGSLPTCEGGYPGLFDMAGNLWEWESSCDPGGATAGCAIHGSSFASNDSTSCTSSRYIPRDRGGVNDVSIRCCSD